MGLALALQAPDELLTTAEVGDYLGVGRTTVGRLLQDGQLPAARVGQRWLIRRSDLEAFAPPKHHGLSGVTKAATADAQDRALRVIADHPGISVTGLAQITGEPRRTALGRLQYLDHQGWIVRTSPGPSDPQRCHLTETGWERYRSQLLATAEPA